MKPNNTLTIRIDDVPVCEAVTNRQGKFFLGGWYEFTPEDIIRSIIVKNFIIAGEKYEQSDNNNN